MHASVIGAFMDLGEEGGLFFSNKLKRSLFWHIAGRGVVERFKTFFRYYDVLL
jgi:hypothetical protein